MRPKLDNELIYKTALPFFARYGYKKTTLDDIAGALDMSNTNLYSYAKSKRDLYDGCVAYAIDQWQEYVRQQAGDVEDPKEKLMVTFRSAVGYFASHDDTMALLRNDPNIFPMFPSIDPIEEYNDWSIGWVRDILEDGMAKGVFREFDTNTLAIMLFNFYKYFIISTMESGIDEPTIQNALETMGSLFLNGLLTGDA